MPINKVISRFHYIIPSVLDINSIQEHLEEVCKAGISCIQLRIKGKQEREWLDIAIMAKEVCDNYSANLIVNDNVKVAQEIDAYGVHLGKTDMPYNEARKILGDHKIIGGTANTLEDVKHLIDAGVDYIGLGPYKYTKTKEILSPILGVDEIKKIVESFSNIPIIAIGGIGLDDLENLNQTGVFGVAVSSAISNSEDLKSTAESFNNKMNDLFLNSEIQFA
ncbi:MAG: thiamine phosphate synthase [Bacteroidia bacterium]|nr:thiamine phosphate synthase [Bacteroidia bacterium]